MAEDQIRILLALWAQVHHESWTKLLSSLSTLAHPLCWSSVSHSVPCQTVCLACMSLSPPPSASLSSQHTSANKGSLAHRQFRQPDTG